MRVVVKGLSKILEEHAVVFSGHMAELGDAIAVVLGSVAEIDLVDRHVVSVAVVDVGGSHFVICLDDEMVWLV